MIAARLAKLSPPAAELVGLAATIGRSFSFDLLRRAGAFDDDALVRGLDELWQHWIIREQGEQRYDFSHAKLREGKRSGGAAGTSLSITVSASVAQLLLLSEIVYPKSRTYKLKAADLISCYLVPNSVHFSRQSTSNRTP